MQNHENRSQLSTAINSRGEVECILWCKKMPSEIVYVAPWRYESTVHKIHVALVDQLVLEMDLQDWHNKEVSRD